MLNVPRFASDIICCVGWKWQGQFGTRLVRDKVADRIVVSDADCMNECLLHDICDSINYRPSDLACELNTHPDSGTDTADMVIDCYWMHWSIAPDYIVL